MLRWRSIIHAYKSSRTKGITLFPTAGKKLPELNLISLYTIDVTYLALNDTTLFLPIVIVAFHPFNYNIAVRLIQCLSLSRVRRVGDGSLTFGISGNLALVVGYCSSTLNRVRENLKHVLLQRDCPTVNSQFGFECGVWLVKFVQICLRCLNWVPVECWNNSIGIRRIFVVKQKECYLFLEVNVLCLEWIRTKRETDLPAARGLLAVPWQV